MITMNKKGRIGIFDSGFGGLSILREIVKVMPQYDYVYLGDSARAPYGSHSQETIYEYTKEGIDFLFSEGAEIIILACNSASSDALHKIQQEYLPAKYMGKKVLGVIIPACEDAVLKTRNKKVGVLGTEATVVSGAFDRELKKLDPKIEVYQQAAPLLVPLVEAGEEESESAKTIVKRYIDEIISNDIDTLILGCTHYSFFEHEIHKYAPDICLVTEGPVIGLKLLGYLHKHSEVLGKLGNNGGIEFCTTDSSEMFDLHGSRFFGSAIISRHVKVS